MKVAILGAGLSGCALYSQLSAKGYETKVFDKARGVGGRISTKYVDEYFIDHGTPSFEATSSAFISFCEKCIDNELLRKFDGKYLPTQGINKIARLLIDREDLIKSTRIATCSNKYNKWQIQDDKNNIYDGFDILISTIPVPQLLALELPLQIQQELQSVQYDADATLILHGNEPLDISLIQDEDIRICIDNSKKYGYKDFYSYVIHASKGFSNKYANSDKMKIEELLCEKLERLLGFSPREKYTCMGHLWRYAFVSHPLDMPYFYDERIKLGLCGDFFGSEGLQSSYLSAQELSKIL